MGKDKEIENTPDYVFWVRVKAGAKASDGTGFAVGYDDGRIMIVTCQHVTSPQGTPADTIDVYQQNRGGKIRCEVNRIALSDDLVLLRSVTPVDEPFRAVTLHENWLKSVRTDARVTAWGNSSATTLDRAKPIDCGVGGFDRQDGLFSLVGPINHGDSGGPIVDASGQVVGVVRLKSDQRESDALAIPASRVHALLENFALAAPQSITANPKISHPEQLALRCDRREQASRVQNSFQAFLSGIPVSGRAQLYVLAGSLMDAPELLVERLQHGELHEVVAKVRKNAGGIPLSRAIEVHFPNAKAILTNQKHHDAFFLKELYRALKLDEEADGQSSVNDLYARLKPLNRKICLIRLYLDDFDAASMGLLIALQRRFWAELLPPGDLPLDRSLVFVIFIEARYHRVLPDTQRLPKLLRFLQWGGCYKQLAKACADNGIARTPRIPALLLEELKDVTVADLDMWCAEMQLAVSKTPNYAHWRKFRIDSFPSGAPQPMDTINQRLIDFLTTEYK